MSENTKIEWCDMTFNPWIGCTKVSLGCVNCYAERQDARFGHDCFGKGKPRRRTGAAYWKKPLKWNKEAGSKLEAWNLHVELCRQTGISDPRHEWRRQADALGSTEEAIPRRPRVFCGSMCDWLDDEVPIEWLGDFLEIVDKCRNLDFLLLTKRPENWKTRIERVISETNLEPWKWLRRWVEFNEPPSNVWIGTTVENQEMADKRIPELLRIPAKVRFLSCEPLLGPVDLLKASPCRQTLSQCHARGLFPNCNGMPAFPKRCLLEGIH